jgi:hypothetical protein
VSFHFYDQFLLRRSSTLELERRSETRIFLILHLRELIFLIQ